MAERSKEVFRSCGPMRLPTSNCHLFSDFQEGEIWQAAIFDAIVDHTDHTHNFAAAPKDTTPRRLRLFDNAFAFSYQGNPPNSLFFNEKQGAKIPAHLLEDLGRLASRAPHSSLRALLGKDTFEKLIERIRALVDSEHLTIPATP
jgi:hypothetical protein